MKKRWLIALTAFALAAGVVLPPLAADADYFFTKRYDLLTWMPSAGWVVILEGGKPLWFYLLLCALTALLILWVMLTGSYLNYRSDMQQITPDIQTPRAAGQGQFGTARWLDPKEITRFFGVWRVPQKDPAFQALLAAGEKDREEIINADIQLD